MKNLLFSLFVLGVFLSNAYAQFPIEQSFRSTTAPGWTLGNNTTLTAASGVDSDGSGWLRLTRGNFSELGYAWLNQDFSPEEGLIVEFDFVEWSANFQGADGFSLVFYDAADGAFAPGEAGGSLGYLNAPGNVFLGVGISGTYPAGFTGSAHSVAVRSSKSSSISSLAAGSLPSTPLGFGNASSRPTDSNTANNRRIRVKWSVDDSLLIDLKAGGNEFARIISVGNLSSKLVLNPASFRVALVGSNGGLTAFHEVRNLTIDTDVTTKTTNSTLITETTARMNGYVHAITGPTTVQFFFGTESGMLGDSVNAFQSPLADSGYFPVYADLTELVPDTRYFYQVEAINDSGAFSGGETSFTTLPVEPSAQPTLATPTPSSLSAKIRWTPTEGAQTIVLMNDSESLDDVPVDGSSYSATGSYASGPIIGNSRVVFSGTGDSVLVSGLTEETTYTILVFSYNPGSFGKPNYKTTSPVTGTVVTEPLPLLLVQSDFSNGHLYSKLADMNNDGNLDIISFGDYLYVTMADGEGGFYESFDTGIINGTNGFTTLEVADFDNDGLSDIFFNGYNASGILLNGGEGPFLTEQETFPTGFNSISAVLDFNRDGLLDILLSNSETPTFQLFRNTGSGFEDIELGITGKQMGAISVADFNKDGFPDFIFTGANGDAYSGRETAIYLNDEGQSFYPMELPLTGVHFGDVKTADFNNDSWPDFIYSGSTGDGGRLLAVGLNDQNGGFLVHTRTFENEEGPRTIARASAPGLYELPDPMAAVGIGVADFNMDGLSDVILSGTTGGDGQGTIQMWLNAGESGFSPFTEMPFPYVYKSRIATGDINGDGSPDFILTGFDYNEDSFGYYLYQNEIDGSNSAPAVPEGLDAAVNGNSVTLSWDPSTDDLSNTLQYAVRIGTSETGNDVVSVVTDETGLTGVPEYQNAGYNTDFLVTSLTPGWYYWQVQAVDAGFSSSGFSAPDSFEVTTPLVIEAPTGLILTMDGDTLVATWNQVLVDSLSHYRYYLGTEPGVWTISGSTDERTPQDTSYRFVNLGAGVRYYVAVSSVDTLGNEGQLSFARNIFISPFQLADFSYVSNYRESMVSADLNQDGLMDLIFTTDTGGGEAIKPGTSESPLSEITTESLTIALNTIDNVEADFFTSVPTGVSEADAVLAGDFNGDTRVDLLVVSPGGIFLLINGEESLEFYPISESNFAIGLPDLVSGDFNNDMLLDFIVVSNNGSAIFYQTEPGSFISSGLPVGSIDDGSVSTADFDLDGDLDLLITGYHNSGGRGGEVVGMAAEIPTDDEVTVLLENVGGEVGWEAIETTFPGVYRGNAEFADFNGDGYPDVVLNGAGGNSTRYLKVFNNNGDKTFTDLEVPANGLARGSVKTGDLNNDGLADFVYLGAYISQNYYSMNLFLSNGDGSFSVVDSTIFNPVYDGEITLSDLDGDGDLDIAVLGNFQSGSGGGVAITQTQNLPDEEKARLEILDGDYLAVYLNKYGNSVTRPTPPTEVTVTSNFDSLHVSFDPGADEETPATGLSYNLRIRPAAWEGGYAEIFPASADSATGISFVAMNGLISGSRSWYFHSVPDGSYWVSVQSVDAGFQTSEFTEEILITVNQSVPVELASFDYSVQQEEILLIWKTVTETANAGFNIQRMNGIDKQWVTLGFIAGQGTSTQPHSYQFTDKPGNGSFSYRLQQVDLDGSTSFSAVLDVIIKKPAIYSLEQNYPNPFNPTTRINYSVATSGLVTITLYDVLGRELQNLVSEIKPAGSHFFELDGRNLASGIYFYRLESGSYSQLRKMTLLK